MYARRQTRPKPRTSQLKSFGAPIGGWVSNKSIAESLQAGEIQGAAILDNFYPKATSVVLRRGKQLYATMGNGQQPAEALFTYINGESEKLFGATPTTIYDLSNVLTPYDIQITTEKDELIVTEQGDWFGEGSTDSFVVSGGYSGGDWSTVQFATTGDTYLIGVNGQDAGFLYDGDTFYPNVPGGITRLDYDTETVPLSEGDTLTGATSGATARIVRIVAQGAGTGQLWLAEIAGGPFIDNETITDTDGGTAKADGVGSPAAPGVTFGTSGKTTADMSFVWVYKERLWFVERNSMNAWYLGVDSIGGTAKLFPLAGIFGRGGSLVFGQTWSLDGGNQGGLSEQCIFVSSEGEVAVYQGVNPDESATWSKVGLYRIGTPLGKRAFLRGGGDIAVATSVGLVPLSKAIALDISSLNIASVSYKIADAWHDAVTQRGLTGWQCAIWPEERMAVVSPPVASGSDQPVLFISNTDTGAWARYTNWHALSMAVFRGRLYFGSPEGKVFIANVSGMDDTDTYSGSVMPLFEDLGSPASAKVGKIARAVMRANAPVVDRVDMRVDYDLTLPTPPDATPLTAGNLWGTGKWGSSQWGSLLPTINSQEWRSVGGIGYSCTVSLQVTSGSIAPIDAELIRMDLTYTVAEIVT